MNEQEVRQVFEFLKGKRIKVLTYDRDNRGKQLPTKNTWIHGECYFLGNGIWGLQVTVDRMPIPIDSLLDVELVD